MSIYDACVDYAERGAPLVILAGKEYGSGSSRDWAAKGPKLLGIRAVIAESYERIHRSNLVGMGILPLQFRPARPPNRSASPARKSSPSTGRPSKPCSTQIRGRPNRSQSSPRTTRRQNQRVLQPSCASTPRRKSSTTSTAASCPTSSANSPETIASLKPGAP